MNIENSNPENQNTYPLTIALLVYFTVQACIMVYTMIEVARGIRKIRNLSVSDRIMYIDDISSYSEINHYGELSFYGKLQNKLLPYFIDNFLFTSDTVHHLFDHHSVEFTTHLLARIYRTNKVIKHDKHWAKTDYEKDLHHYLLFLMPRHLDDFDCCPEEIPLGDKILHKLISAYGSIHSMQPCVRSRIMTLTDYHFKRDKACRKLLIDEYNNTNNSTLLTCIVTLTTKHHVTDDPELFDFIDTVKVDKTYFLKPFREYDDMRNNKALCD